MAVKSTSDSVRKVGDYVERKHGKKRNVKLHFVVSVDIHEVVTTEVSTDDMNDVKALPGWWKCLVGRPIGLGDGGLAL